MYNFHTDQMKQLDSFPRVNSVETTQVPVSMVRERSGALMSPRGPGAVALTLGFTSLRSHPVPSLRWGCESTMKYFPLTSFSAPWRRLSGGCHLSDGCHLTHDYGSGSPRMLLLSFLSCLVCTRYRSTIRAPSVIWGAVGGMYRTRYVCCELG